MGIPDTTPDICRKVGTANRIYPRNDMRTCQEVPATYTAFAPGDRIRFLPPIPLSHHPYTGTVVDIGPRYMHVECDQDRFPRCVRLTRANFRHRRARILLGEPTHPRRPSPAPLAHHPDMSGPATAELMRAIHRSVDHDLTRARHGAEVLYNHLAQLNHAQTPQENAEVLHHVMHLTGGLPLAVRSTLIRHLG